MNRTTAFLLPPMEVERGVPIIDRLGRKGTVLDKWYCAKSKQWKVMVCIYRTKGSRTTLSKNMVAKVYSLNEVRVDLGTDIGYVYALREYFKLVNAKSREEVKAYVWTWGDLHEQAVKWWAASTDGKDEKRLVDKLIKTTDTQEH